MPKQVLHNDSAKLSGGVKGVEAAHKLIVRTFLGIEVVAIPFVVAAFLGYAVPGWVFMGFLVLLICVWPVFSTGVVLGAIVAERGFAAVKSSCEAGEEKERELNKQAV